MQQCDSLTITISLAESIKYLARDNAHLLSLSFISAFFVQRNSTETRHVFRTPDVKRLSKYFEINRHRGILQGNIRLHGVQTVAGAKPNRNIH